MYVTVLGKSEAKEILLCFWLFFKPIKSMGQVVVLLLLLNTEYFGAHQDIPATCTHSDGLLIVICLLILAGKMFIYDWGYT